MKNTELDQKDKKLAARQEILSWVQSIIISVVVVALVFTFIGRVVNVDGESMEPNFHDNDKIVTTNIHGDFQRGDVVVIKRKQGEPLIKRVIATAGQTIDINYETGVVTVDGTVIDEPYIAEPTNNNLGVELPATVPENCVFVMGDNRNHSDDSRNPNIGMINEKKIFGKVVFRLFPIDSFGTIDNFR